MQCSTYSAISPRNLAGQAFVINHTQHFLSVVFAMHNSETAFLFFWAAGVFVDKQLPRNWYETKNFIRSFHLVMLNSNVKELKGLLDDSRRTALFLARKHFASQPTTAPMRRDVVSTDWCEVLLHCILFLRLFAAMSGPHFCNVCKNHWVLTRVSHIHRQNCPWRECVYPPCTRIRRQNEFGRSINRAITSTSTASTEAGPSGLLTVSAAALLSTANAATADGSATFDAAARAGK